MWRLSHKHIQPAKAASVLCISGHTMGSRSITVMEPHPVGHMDSMEAELKGQVTHWRVMFISFNDEAVSARLQQSFFIMDFLVLDAHFIFSVALYISSRFIQVFF